MMHVLPSITREHPFWIRENEEKADQHFQTQQNLQYKATPKQEVYLKCQYNMFVNVLVMVSLSKRNI